MGRPGCRGHPERPGPRRLTRAYLIWPLNRLRGPRFLRSLDSSVVPRLYLLTRVAGVKRHSGLTQEFFGTVGLVLSRK